MKLNCFCWAAALFLAANLPARPQGFTVQHTFTNAPDGSSPGQLTWANGVIYGNTVYGGSATSDGTLFAFSTNAAGYKTIYTFTGGAGNGTAPNSLLVSNNTIYGTTVHGGAGNNGTVFSVGTNGAGFVSLYNFGTNAAGGIDPQGGLLLLGGTLYGTTSSGGFLSGTNNGGTIFKINTNGTGYSVLHWFTNSPDGYGPQGELVSDGAKLYGITSGGGYYHGGVIFAINLNGSGYTILYAFTNIPDGYTPYNGLVLDGSTLYGTTLRGGTNNTGTIFALSTTGSEYRQLYNFGNYTFDGAQAEAKLTLRGNCLYGTTLTAGSGGSGTLFLINTNGTGFTVLHSFTNDVYGSNPQNGVIRVGNALWGTTSSGGMGGNGVFYNLLMPAITDQPQSVSATNGNSVFFDVTAADDSPMTYQWYFNTTRLLSGETNATLSLTAANNNAGSYTVVVADSFGTVTSSPALLTVAGSEPVISAQPQDLIITNGGLVSFTVLASGQGPMQYQWYSNTVSTALGMWLAGKTNSTYSFTAVTAANNRFYTVVISNSLGRATSDPALLTVVTKPLITTNPQPVTANLGSVASFSVSVVALAPRYQWYSNSVSTAIGTRLFGQTNSTYSFTAVNGSNGRYYTVVVTNVYGATTSSPASLTVGSLPYITLAPIGVTITNGASVTFTSTAAGPGPLTYQWLFATNVIIAGATNTILTFSNANLPGMYSMKVANSSGSVTSSPAQLTVISRPAMLAATFDASSGSYSFTCINVAGATNRLWASTNLASPSGWRPIATNIMPTNGVWFYMDSHAAKTNAARFYRFSSP